VEEDSSWWCPIPTWTARTFGGADPLAGAIDRSIALAGSATHYGQHRRYSLDAADTVSTMLRRADAALYTAKHAGRNCVRTDLGSRCRRCRRFGAKARYRHAVIHRPSRVSLDADQARPKHVPNNSGHAEIARRRCFERGFEVAADSVAIWPIRANGLRRALDPFERTRLAHVLRPQQSREVSWRSQ